MIVKPFRAVRPRSDLSERIASLPYDVVNSAEARRMADGDPYSFLHVIRPEIDLPADTPPYSDAVYRRGAENLRAMIEKGWLVRDARPAYYVYRLTMDGRSQTGVLGAVSVEEYRSGNVKRHEHTRPEKEQDRIRLNDALSAHPGPVFLTHRRLPELSALVNGVVASEPEVAFVAADGIRHEVWVVDDPRSCASFEAAFERLPHSYVADGHHRAAAAAKVAGLRETRETGGEGREAWRFFLGAHFPSDELRVLDYNRVVRDLNGMDRDTMLARLERRGFHVDRDHRRRRPTAPETFGLYLDGHWYLLSPRPELVPKDVVGRLDVSILYDQVLSPLLGVGDPRTDRRIDFIGGIRGMEELERLVDSGEYAVAFALYPTRLDQVMEVADSGEVMPPKSTWFEPKLRSGLIVQTFDDGL
jgi:uncharacterized protein (DUF1015 family)